MRVALFDPFSGISGNMVLGALIDAGLEVADLSEMLAGLGVGKWEITTEKVTRSGFTGILVNVQFPLKQPHRGLPEIVALIEDAGLPGWVCGKSLLAFRRLAGTEASVHGQPVDEVHFHEVGAIDAIIDIVGSFAGLFLLGVEKVFCSPVAIGKGVVECSHGTLPLPAPATVKLLEGVPLLPTSEPCELTTPTGAAIITAAVSDWNSVAPLLRIEVSGMGAGNRDLARSNLLRVSVGEVLGGQAFPGANADSCIMLTTVIDDLDPRLWPGLSRSLLEAGAVDCYAAHCIGRKGRPALEVTVLCPNEAEVRNRVAETLFVESSTLGIRIDTVTRLVLERRFEKVATRWGDVTVKVGVLGERIVSAEPEFEECAALAERNGVSTKLVLQEAKGKAMDVLRGENRR